MKRHKFLLTEDQIPEHYYNVIPDLPEPPAPPLHPATREPVGPDALEPLFPPGLIEQEASDQGEIPIPEPVREAYALYRPTPLIRAHRFEQALGTPAHIYYKAEGVSPAGSHKVNTALAQAYYNHQAGVTRVITETGAGQWGSALAFARNLFPLDLEVFMVKVSYEQKPYRRSLVQTYGAQITPSPSGDTAAGRAVLEAEPDSPGSLGIAIAEAVEVAANDPKARYALGSVLNHVLLHQTIIGQEARAQMQLAGEQPDVVIGCHGGGSNFAGIAFPFLRDRAAGAKEVRLLACEPRSCPTLTEGEFRYDFGDSVGLTPLLKMYTLGHDFVPPAIHAGGLRYHGAAPLVSHLKALGLVEAAAFSQRDCFESALRFARCEGIVPAPESSHAVHGAVLEAARAREEGRERVILFNLSGHGHFDMAAYDGHLAGS